MFNFTSTAIENITDVQDDQVTITFSGGRDYTYKVADPANFVSQLNEVIEQEESVGRFINAQIRNEQLQSIWSRIKMTKQLLISQLRQGNSGNEILQILDVLCSGMDDSESREESGTLNEIEFWLIS